MESEFGDAAGRMHRRIQLMDGAITADDRPLERPARLPWNRPKPSIASAVICRDVNSIRYDHARARYANHLVIQSGKSIMLRTCTMSAVMAAIQLPRNRFARWRDRRLA